MMSGANTRNRIVAGEVVLFPGVRYEYHAAPEEPTPAKARRKSRKRDKLELKD